MPRANGIYTLRENQEPYRAVFDPEKVDSRPQSSYLLSEYVVVTG